MYFSKNSFFSIIDFEIFSPVVNWSAGITKAQIIFATRQKKTCMPSFKSSFSSD